MGIGAGFATSFATAASGTCRRIGRLGRAAVEATGAAAGRAATFGLAAGFTGFLTGLATGLDAFAAFAVDFAAGFLDTFAFGKGREADRAAGLATGLATFAGFAFAGFDFGGAPLAGFAATTGFRADFGAGLGLFFGTGFAAFFATGFCGFARRADFAGDAVFTDFAPFGAVLATGFFEGAGFDFALAGAALAVFELEFLIESLDGRIWGVPYRASHGTSAAQRGRTGIRTKSLSPMESSVYT
jgi:hypothetical protein